MNKVTIDVEIGDTKLSVTGPFKLHDNFDIDEMFLSVMNEGWTPHAVKSTLCDALRSRIAVLDKTFAGSLRQSAIQEEISQWRRILTALTGYSD